MPDFYADVGPAPLVLDPNDPNCNVDFRAELTQIIVGEGRGTTVLYRKIQFEDGQPKRCPCWDDLTQEPDIDTQCRICRGTGYFFNDFVIRTYRSQSQGFSATRRHQDTGVQQLYLRTFYCEYDFISAQSGDNLDIPTTYDKIIELEMDIDGVIVSPLRTRIKYDIISVDPYRLEEGGRIEYYRIRTRGNLEDGFIA
jgi:hypothetical protein